MTALPPASWCCTASLPRISAAITPPITAVREPNSGAKANNAPTAAIKTSKPVATEPRDPLPLRPFLASLRSLALLSALVLPLLPFPLPPFLLTR